MPNVRLLDYDKATPFVSYSFGNISAGAIVSPRLVFADSYASGTASGAEFGVSSVAGNDGYTFAQVASGSTFNASGSAVTGTVLSTGGGIGSGTSLRYKLSVKDPYGWESYHDTVTYTPSLSGTTTNLVSLSWSAVSGTSQYGVYLSVDSGTTFKLVGFTTNAYYTDTSGTATATTPPASGSVGYRPGTWGTTAVAIGDMASGTQLPMFFKEVVPSGTGSAGNPRQHYIYVSYLTT